MNEAINNGSADRSYTNNCLGEFYTPDRVVKSFHNLIVEQLGDIYNEYYVWDPAWGTGNLTKNFKFEHLFCSTLRSVDLRKARNNNKESTKFVYDFLNDDVDALTSLQERLTHEYKMPSDLLDAVKENRKILILMNPPYAGTGNMGTLDNGSKSIGGDKSAMRLEMSNSKMGYACDNLYAQFLYRVLLMKKAYRLTNISIAVICPPQYLTVASYKVFRDAFLSEFKYLGGKLFRASEFDGLNGDWGISMAVYDSGSTDDRSIFRYDVISYDENEAEVVINKGLPVYNIDNGVRANDWVVEGFKGVEKGYIPVFTSGCKVKEKKYYGFTDAIAYVGNKANNVEHNRQEVVIVSGQYSDCAGLPIDKNNLSREVMYFTARKLFIDRGIWQIDKYEYSRPNFESADEKVRRAIKRLEVDGFIFTLFNTSNQVTSMKNVKYIDNSDNVQYKRVKNELFWLSKDDIKTLYTRCGNELVDKDYELDTERLGYTMLQQYIKEGSISNQAMSVLSLANDLVIKTMKFRGKCEISSTYGLDCWDAGWYQIKQLVKEYMPDEFKDFCKKYNELLRSMQQCVYDSGMFYV